MNPQPLFIVLGASLALMLAGWLVHQRRRNLALADLLWAAAISASALYYGLVADGAMLPRLLVAMMGGIGGFRLFMHILQRLLVEPMNSRQRMLRERVGASPSRAFGLFVSKALTATLFSIPFLVAASNPVDRAGAATVIAAIVYVVGLSGEAYADIQLSQFRDQPRNFARTCRRGLWRYSRHPNYFFAIVHWCTYPLLAIGVAWPLWTLTLIGPVLTAAITLRRIPIVENEALAARGEDYRDYQRATPALVPMLPKGWPNEAPDAPSWYTPPPPSRGQPAISARGTPLPGARITPSPASWLEGRTGPTTPKPRARPKAAEESARPKKQAAGHVDD